MDRRHTPRPQHILVAEDSDDLRLMWKAWLTCWGFTVDEARNGIEAVRKAETRHPDLILMDLWMPVLDGFAAAARLRDRPATANVPILALTASADRDALARATLAGCEALVAKPVLPEELLAHLRKAFAKANDRMDRGE